MTFAIQNNPQTPIAILEEMGALSGACSPTRRMDAPKMPLTNIAIQKAKAGKKPVRLYDSGGLYVEISPAGGKLWRLKYRFGGKEKRLALGVYPDVPLTKARDNRDKARQLLADG